MPEPFVIYTGVFLEPKGRAQLLAVCQPKYDVVYADHVTHLDQPNPYKLPMDLFGKLFRVRLREIHDDGQFQVARVEFTTPRLLPKKWTPHIAISGRKGISPRYAIEMMKGSSRTEDCVDLTVFGVYAAFYNTDKPACVPEALCGVCHRCSTFSGPANKALPLFSR